MFKKTIIILIASLLASPVLAKQRRRVPADQQKKVVVENVTQAENGKQKLKTKKPTDKNLKAATKKENSQSIHHTTKTKVVDIKAEQNTWRKGKNTVVQLKGQASEDSARCKAFQVRLEEELEYKIDCIGQQMNAKFDLVSSASRTVTQKDGHVTITQYGYLIKKPRVSKEKNSTLKVPFVEQIIHIKRTPGGQLSFYFERFKEDEFGRIVQDGFVQAHSLTNEKMKISAY